MLIFEKLNLCINKLAKNPDALAIHGDDEGVCTFGHCTETSLSSLPAATWLPSLLCSCFGCVEVCEEIYRRVLPRRHRTRTGRGFKWMEQRCRPVVMDLGLSRFVLAETFGHSRIERERERESSLLGG